MVSQHVKCSYRCDCWFRSSRTLQRSRQRVNEAGAHGIVDRFFALVMTPSADDSSPSAVVVVSEYQTVTTEKSETRC